jgi:predicted  nucleic acid-binding Zn-ribbon protein
MLTPVLQALLVLQDRDLLQRSLAAQLRAVPEDQARVERQVAAEKAAIEAARGELKELESRKKLLEIEISTSEGKVAQYRTQQLSIRKNDEYQAMGQQIAATQEAIGRLEEQELGVMFAIDEARKRFEAAAAVLQTNIAGHEARLAVLRQRAAALTAEVRGAEEAVAAARAGVEPLRLRAYDRVAARQMPVVVPIHGGKCGGCHLKVSSEVESAARAKAPDPIAPLPTCDQCGRIVHWES